MTDDYLQSIRERWEKHKALRLPHSGAVRLPAPDVDMIDKLLAEVAVLHDSIRVAKEAVRDYGTHLGSCRLNVGPEPAVCSCGFAKWEG